MERVPLALADLTSAAGAADHGAGTSSAEIWEAVTEGGAGALGGRRLENTANNVARAGQRPDRHLDGDHRASRWEALGVLWRESSLDRVRSCRRWPISPDGTVQVRARGGAAGYAGLPTCGSVWACAVCNSRITAGRRLELGLGLSRVLDTGSAAFGAYTVHHHAGSDLDTTWRSLSALWRAVAQDKKVREARADLGLIGTTRSAEVTWSPANGWHPHIHPLQFFALPVSSTDVDALHAEQLRAWCSAAERRSLTAPRAVAQRLRLVVPEHAEDALADYLAKGTYASSTGLGWEMTSTQTKSSTRAKGATPWDLLHAVHHLGDADALALWHVWERGSKGKKALTWSRGLRARLGLDQERTDDDLAAEVVGDEHDTGLTLDDWSWARSDARAAGVLLSEWHRGGWGAVRAFCDDRGIPYREAR